MTGPATCCAPTTARPDPRSALQPEGVDGPSQVVDTTAWDRTLWTDSGWAGRELVGSVVYELHVGTFTPAGTLDGVIERLPYLAELGVDMVELMPLAGFPGRAGWGYDGMDLWAVHEAYGGPQALARLVDAAHAHGLGVCLDVVYNHLGPAGNHLGAFGPYFTDAHRTPWGQAVNYDQAGSDQVRAFVIDSALRWLRDFHVDALRLDAIHAIHDDSPRHVLAEMADAVHALGAELGRPLGLVAESDLNDVGVITPHRRPRPGRCAEPGDGRPVGRRRPPRPARAPDRGEAGLLRGLRRPGGLHQGLRAGLPPRRDPLHLPGPDLGCAGTPGHRPAPLRRLRLRPRPGGQPRHRGPSQREPG